MAKSLFKFSIFLILSILVSIILLFTYVDKKVKKRLDVRENNSEIPAIYSRPVVIRQGEKIPEKILRRMLFDREYENISSSVKKPGQFFNSDGLFYIYTRSFRNSNSKFQESVKIKYDSLSGEVVNLSGNSKNHFFLEPEIIAPILGHEYRASRYKTINEIPKILINAVVAVEDQRFFSHPGIDVSGIMRAMLANIKAGRIVQGGSTITQQLAKNILFTPKKTLSRKLLEASAAFSIENRLSKEKVIEMYLNEVYLGQEGSVAIHGMGQAANAFFSKELEDLNISEAAMLAGIIKAPSYFSPKRHPQRSQDRKEVVLKLMKSSNLIDEDSYNKNIKKKVNIKPNRIQAKRAPYFVDAIRREGAKAINLEEAFLDRSKIHTGLDLFMQKCAEKSVSDQLEILNKGRKSKKLQGSLIAIEPHSGLIRAWVGGDDYRKQQFDRASQAQRQIGSTIKPFVYLTALDAKLNYYKVATADTIISDEPLEVEVLNQDTWVPENYDKTFRGYVTLRYALERSLNIPAAYLAQKVGLKAVKRTVESFRLAPSVLAVPSLSLGAIDTNLLRLTAAYGALANGGIYVEPRLYTSIIDGENEILDQKNIKEDYIASEDAVYVLTNILQGVIERGTSTVIRRMGFMRPAAGKTGTSNETRDAWFLGYLPNLTAGAWVGFDDNSKTGLTGAGASAPIWANFMKCVEPILPKRDFIQPPGVRYFEIDSETGYLASDKCDEDKRTKEIFVIGTEPKQVCGGRNARPISKTNNLVFEKKDPIKKRTKQFWDIIFDE